jgi:hypothetical protein
MVVEEELGLGESILVVGDDDVGMVGIIVLKLVDGVFVNKIQNKCLN